ncbi:hypothetical protein [Sediminicurvatus halobius]|uniref:Major tail protein n=1 Tax=Sediminicurvatus halobius TaxID=2182432 RepID=A0A2U2MYA0_9GAMM|nr:hypothetical protein [Spiribacter halobius]PWG61773.1 hypothetical protein DEM34_15010 [Spiribacter halobius]UEX76792.1 hypothetical protein LMH63_12590 [Spiribacter halobius]
MTVQSDLSFVGTGRLFMADRSTGAYIDVGNVSAAQLSPQEQTRELPDYTQPGGGLRNSLSRITSVNFELTMRDFTIANLARALQGSGSEVTAGTMTAEPVTAAKGTALIPLPFTDLSAVTVTDATDGTTTYTGFTVTGAGLLVTAGGDLETAIEGSTDGLDLEIDADYGAHGAVQTLTEAGKEFSVIFDGLDEAQSGEPYVVSMHRVKFSPTSALSLITEDGFGELPLTGRLLADSSKGAGLSQYAEIRRKSVS